MQPGVARTPRPVRRPALRAGGARREFLQGSTGSFPRPPGCLRPRTQSPEPCGFSSGSRLHSFLYGNCEIEDAAPTGLGFDPDAALMVLDHLLANGQADAGAGISSFRMQSLEHIEDLLAMSRLDPNAVVAHREHPLVAVALGRDMHARWLIAAELDR